MLATTKKRIFAFFFMPNKQLKRVIGILSLKQSTPMLLSLLFHSSVDCKSTSYGLILVLVNRNGGYQSTSTLKNRGKTHVVVFCSGTHSRAVIQCLYFFAKAKNSVENLGRLEVIYGGPIWTRRSRPRFVPVMTAKQM